MDVETIKRMIGQCDNPAELAEVRRAADERSKLVHDRIMKKKQADFWDRVKGLSRGAKLYCCADGIFMGGNVQRGTAMTVYCVQPRRKRLWVILEGETQPHLWFGPVGLERYNLRAEPPDHPVSPGLATAMKEVGEVLDKALK